MSIKSGQFRLGWVGSVRLGYVRNVMSVRSVCSGRSGQLRLVRSGKVRLVSLGQVGQLSSGHGRLI